MPPSIQLPEDRLISASMQNIDREGSPFKLVAVPIGVGDIIAKFMVDRAHGNITLNFQDGQIKKVVVEQHHKIG